MDVAALSVVTSGLVGLGGLTVPVLLDRRADARRKTEMQHVRLDELRAVVDEAAQSLARAMAAAPQVEEVRAGAAAVSEAMPRLRAALFDVWSQEARLASRLGSDDALVLRFNEAHQALGALHIHWAGWVRSGANMDDLDADLTNLINGVHDAMTGFYDAAAGRVGPSRAE